MNDSQAQSIDPTDETWSVPSDAPLQAVLDRPDTPPLLRQALTGVLSWQARNETPIQRALTAPRITPQWVAALLALGATVTVEAEGGPTRVPLEAFLHRRTAGEVSALHIPKAPVAWGEAHVARTPTDEPIVVAFAVVEMDGNAVRQARVALAGVWPEPARLAQAPARLTGGPLDDEHIRAVAESVEKEITPRGDFRGSAEYRRAMAGVLTRRALEAAWWQGEAREGKEGREGREGRQEARGKGQEARGRRQGARDEQ